VFDIEIKEDIYADANGRVMACDPGAAAAGGDDPDVPTECDNLEVEEDESDPAAVGSGTSDDPYILCTAYQVNGIHNHAEFRDVFFRVGNNIDMSVIAPDDQNYISGYRAATFDGAGHTISNLAIPLFGTVESNASVINLRINSNLPMRTNNNSFLTWGLGALASQVYESEIRNVHVRGGPGFLLKGARAIGGIVGTSRGTSFFDSSAIINFEGQHQIGGLVGELHDGRIERSFAISTISGINQLGGLIGESQRVSILNSFARSTVTSLSTEVGGLVGRHVGDSPANEILNSFASVNITSSYNGSKIGGLIGSMEGGVKIQHSYSYGLVTGGGWSIGGLVGILNGLQSCILDSYSTLNINPTGAEAYYIGGLVGEIRTSYCPATTPGFNSMTIERSFATGEVRGTQEVGGLVGLKKEDSTFHHVYASGDVFGESRLGGLVGSMTGGQNDRIKNTYATGNVTKIGNVTTLTHFGGLVGDNSSVRVLHSYSSGNVSAPESSEANQIDFMGGFIGGGKYSYEEERAPVYSFSTGNVSGFANKLGKSYGESYDLEFDDEEGPFPSLYISEQSTCENFSSGKDCLVQPSLLKQNLTSKFYNKNNEPLRNWDFSNVWQQNTNALPTLRNMPPSTWDFSSGDGDPAVWKNPPSGFNNNMPIPAWCNPNLQTGGCRF
jgi:hypothetical protein